MRHRSLQQNALLSHGGRGGGSWQVVTVLCRYWMDKGHCNSALFMCLTPWNLSRSTLCQCNVRFRLDLFQNFTAAVKLLRKWSVVFLQGFLLVSYHLACCAIADTSFEPSVALASLVQHIPLQMITVLIMSLTTDPNVKDASMTQALCRYRILLGRGNTLDLAFLKLFLSSV